jgi:hypothetical protein
MSLDLFASNVDDAVNYAARVSAPELPSTFSDNFSDAWNRGFLTSQSVSGTNRKVEARSQLVDDAIAKTGDRTLAAFISPTGDDSDFEGFNRRIAEHNAARPDDPVQPLSSEEIQARADRIGVQQLSDSRSLASRERTTGGTIGQFLGTAGAAVTDPVNLVAFPLAAPEALGILGTTLAWSAIGAGSQGVIEALNASNMERIQPGYRDSNEPLRNILEAGAGAAVIGGGLKGLSNLWSRAKTGQWPRTIRDAGNVVESEAQIASTNPLPGVEGEAMHRTALQKAIDDIANGRPVDVDGIATPEQFAVRDVAVDPVMSARDAAVESRAAAQSREVVGIFPKKGVAPANLGADGVLYVGAPNSMHFNLSEKYSGSIREKLNLEPGDASWKSEGFVNPDGEFMTRQQAFEWVTANEKKVRSSDNMNERELDAQDYYEQVHETRRAGPTAQPSLPFESTAAQARAELSAADLSKGIQDIARMAGHEMPVEDAAKIAARMAQLNDPDKARALLDEVFLRPQTIADTLPAVEKPASIGIEKINTDTAIALRDEFAPAKVEEMRVDPDLPDTVSRDLDKLMLERPDLEVPTGVTVDAEGRTVPTTRKVESVVAEADARLAAAKEIEACVGPYPAEAAE